MTESSSSL